MGWNQVRWMEAQQVASQVGITEPERPASGITPEQHFRALLDAGEATAASTFLGHALPRLEALAWAARVLEDEARGRDLPRPDRQALDHVLRWLGDPTDANRRAAMDAAGFAGERSPERMLALGVFLSGGSISNPELPAIAPGPELAGRCAAAAISMAAQRSKNPAAVFDRALALGDRMADVGLQALASA